MKVKTEIKAGIGMGDAVQKVCHSLGLDKCAKAFEETTGQCCGCAERQDILNKIMPDMIGVA